ncbi:MAG: hypothetical protein KDI36_07050, partial [Pseudomonadales bacterium]|nr:hypothetical protein [Pseudomonadales bacterium]
MRALAYLLLILLPVLVLPSVCRAAMADIFSVDQRNQKVLEIEAALAEAQAAVSIIPAEAAAEIRAKASIEFAKAEDIAREYAVVEHRMVALLNVWGRSMAGGAEQYVHFGATTVDIYDTLLVLQLLDAAEILQADLLAFEDALLIQAERHAGTVMIGRTLGQHALPITFGKKLAVWLGENRRHLQRLQQVRARLRQSAILKGAVGSYLGLGDDAMKVEQLFAEKLGLDRPYIADWHSSRDVFAEYAQLLALISQSMSRLGTELFLLQMTDIGETVEYRPETVVGSSTMPHKNNPGKSESLIQYGRSIPALA